MRVRLKRQVVKRCPYRDEIDRGTLVIMWADADAAPELHALAQQVDACGSEPTTHEEWTARIAALVPDATVESHWHTGPWRVTCSI